MPVMDGLEVCKQVRKMSDLPIIMLTAKDEDDDRILGLEIGADDYITKPVFILLSQKYYNLNRFMTNKYIFSLVFLIKKADKKTCLLKVIFL